MDPSSESMAFLEVTDDLLQLGVSLREISQALGCSYASVRQARLPRDHSGHRSPPPGWRLRLAAWLRARAGELEAVAAELEKGR